MPVAKEQIRQIISENSLNNVTETVRTGRSLISYGHPDGEPHLCPFH